MIYGSVCSGIEAATVAWHPLNWRPAFFSEIESFPSSVLAHRYPDVPNRGDMNNHREWPDEPIDLLVGGTPCQDFSIAGLRAGLDGERGNLSLEYGRLIAGRRPRWFLWENVPGVLSSNKGRDFATILGLFSGQTVDIPRGGWKNAGIVPGYRNAYGLAWRVLDAQYVRVDGFGRAVPQRRRRVFIVGRLGGDWRHAAAVLFDREGLSGNSAPRREAGKGFTHDAAPSLVSSGRGSERTGVSRGQDAVIGFIPEVGNPLTARMHKGVNTTMDEGQTMVAHALRADGFDASEDGTGRRTPLVPVAFSSKDCGADATDGVSPTLRAMGHAGSHPNAGGQFAIAIQERAVCENPNAGPDGAGFRDDGAAYTIEARSVPQAVAFDLPGREGGAQLEGPHDTANIRAASGGSSRSYLATSYAVRRLTPRECERLQGFPDDYTLIPVSKRNWSRELDEMRDYFNRTGQEYTDEEVARLAADGPRYKAIGNSMAVNVMRWIGRRIEMVEGVL